VNDGFNWEDAIAAGNSYLRVHVRWGFHIDTPTEYDLSDFSQNLVSFGLATTIGDGSETRPDARTGAWPDQDPPTQRWIYWETRAPVVSAVDHASGVVTWRDSGATEPTSTKGQVLATGLGPGDSLNLSSCWASAEPYDNVANQALWVSLSILRKN
jgi:hypothetical protein